MNNKRFNAAYASFLCVFLIIFFVPLVIYQSNSDEFSSGFLQIASRLVFPFILISTCLSLFSFAASNYFSKWVVSFFCVLSVLIYVQSSFLVWNYGILDGNDIEWEAFTYSHYIDLAVWGLGVLIFLFFSGYILRISGKILGILSVILFANILVISFSGQVKWRSQNTQGQLETFYNFSPEKNVVVFLLDAFASPAFDYLINKDPAYAKIFEGFTFFKNATGSFPTTLPSIPAIITSKEYDNSVPVKDFITKAVAEGSFPQAFADSGYQVDLATLPHVCPGMRVNNCTSLQYLTGTDSGRLIKAEAVRITDLSLFRSAPQVLKKLIYNDQNWLLQSYFEPLSVDMHQASALRLPEIFKNNSNTNAVKPTLKFFHLQLPHLPLRVNESCEKPDKSKKGRPRNIQFSEQAGCAIHLTSQMFEKIKEMGIFDSSTIVVLADHGIGLKFDNLTRVKSFPNPAYAMPLLLIKRPGETGQLKISDAQVRTADLSATLASIYGLKNNFPGIPAFENKGEPRLRTFRYYKWNNDFWQKDYLPDIREFQISGEPNDSNNWVETKKLSSKK